jgi:hypothetical protein
MQKNIRKWKTASGKNARKIRNEVIKKGQRKVNVSKENERKKKSDEEKQ